MPLLRSVLRALTLACALLSAPALVAGQVATVGTVESRAFALNTAAVRAPTSQAFSYAGSSFITVHFASFHLADGDKVLVRSVDGATRFEYTGLGRGALGLSGGFFSSRIPGDTAVVEFVPAAQAPGLAAVQGFAIDQITRTARTFSPLTVCGTDDTLPAKCYANDTSIYDKSNAVARLLIKGQTSCTGWLVGSEGHLITNHHCISDNETALQTDFEFQAESASCDDQCRVKGGCPGTVVATSAQLVALDEALDYALVKLDTTADLSRYGALKLRVAGATLAERIFLPQHPGGYAKRIAVVVDDGSFAKVEGVDASSACGDHRVLYTADTVGGSSGSPIIATADNAVVALHSCGVLSEPCVNSGIDIRGLIYDLQTKGVVPRDALDDPTATPPNGPWIPGVTPPPTPPPTPVPTQSVCRIFIYQPSCENTIPGRCKWVDGKCVANDGATLAPTTPEPTTPEPTTPEPTTPEPTTPEPTMPEPTTPEPTTPEPTSPEPTTPAPPTPRPKPSPKPPSALCSVLCFKNLCKLLPSKCAWVGGKCVGV